MNRFDFESHRTKIALALALSLEKADLWSLEKLKGMLALDGINAACFGTIKYDSRLISLIMKILSFITAIFFTVKFQLLYARDNVLLLWYIMLVLSWLEAKIKFLL